MIIMVFGSSLPTKKKVVKVKLSGSVLAAKGSESSLIVSPETLLLEHTVQAAKLGHRVRLRPNCRPLAPLDSSACMFKESLYAISTKIS